MNLTETFSRPVFSFLSEDDDPAPPPGSPTWNEENIGRVNQIDTDSIQPRQMVNGSMDNLTDTVSAMKILRTNETNTVLVMTNTTDTAQVVSNVTDTAQAGSNVTDTGLVEVFPVLLSNGTVLSVSRGNSSKLFGGRGTEDLTISYLKDQFFFIFDFIA